MPSQTIDDQIGDLIVWELHESFSREGLIIKANNTFVVGQVGCRDSTGDIVTIANAQDDVYTLTHVVTADGGSFSLAYRGDAIARQVWNVSTADLQTALRALHVDLDDCVVAGTAGTDYTVTVPHEKKSDIFHLTVANDGVQDGANFQGTTLDRTTYAEHPSVIVLNAVEETTDTPRIPCLVRNAIVDVANVTGQSVDVNRRLAEMKLADDNEYLAGYGGIIARTGPTYTTL